jgi:hypothetical protein
MDWRAYGESGLEPALASFPVFNAAVAGAVARGVKKAATSTGVGGEKPVMRKSRTKKLQYASKKAKALAGGRSPFVMEQPFSSA